MSRLISTPRMQVFDLNGDPLVGGLVYFYAAGTSTPKDTFSDAALTSANTNPVVLNARGEALLFGSGEYKVTIHDADDVLIYTEDSFYFDNDNLKADLASTSVGSRLIDRKSTRLNSSHQIISYAVFCLKKKSILLRSR